jgi:hypothetical protein
MLVSLLSFVSYSEKEMYALRNLVSELREAVRYGSRFARLINLHFAMGKLDKEK